MFQDFSKNKKVKNMYSKGYSLMEMVVAMFIFGIIAVCLALPFSNSINLSANDQDQVNANSLAKRYLKSVEINWQFQSDYDAGKFPDLTTDDNAFGRYTIARTKTDIKDSDNKVILRRVGIKYSMGGKVLAILFSDFDRPQASIK